MNTERELASQSPSPQSEIRELRIQVGLLQSELEQLRREHAALKASVATDVAQLARRYLDSAKTAPHQVRSVDGVIFGGWDRPDGAAEEVHSNPDDGARESRRA